MHYCWQIYYLLCKHSMQVYFEAVHMKLCTLKVNLFGIYLNEQNWYRKKVVETQTEKPELDTIHLQQQQASCSAFRISWPRLLQEHLAKSVQFQHCNHFNGCQSQGALNMKQPHSPKCKSPTSQLIFDHFCIRRSLSVPCGRRLHLYYTCLAPELCLASGHLPWQHHLPGTVCCPR
jgi:hypothetical protein